ncbi:MAG: hypothetical protein LV481_07455 [Methylacidiphilales bacterium]|nr:hypothetical protein [Candidatus Methylacidiphilales bacterium]
MQIPIHLGLFPRVLLGCCLLASVSFPVLGGTWTPDPSLGNVDQHRHLYDIGRAYGDLNFDPDANLVGTHSKKPPNKKQHSTRESTYYAYALLLTGDPADRARAQAILKRVVTLQDTKPGSPTYGAYNWNAEDPPGDLNSAAFIGLTLVDIIDLDRRRPCLDPDVRSQVEKSGRLAVDAVMRRNVNPGYTNISLLSIALAAAGEKLWKIPGAGAWAQAKLDALMTLADDGEFAEYLSPTYTGVALQGAYMAKKFAFSDAFAAKADAAINHLWKQVALSYHAPTYQLGGPYCRAYGDNMLDYCAVLKYFLYLALDGAYPIPDAQFEHDWDMGGVASIADLPIAARPEFKQPPVPWRQWTAVGSPGSDVGSDNTLVRHLSQYKDGNFTLGTIAYQDEWKQKRNLVAFWRNPGPPPLGMSVGFCIDESNEWEALPGFAGEKLHFYSQQMKGAALVAIVASTDVPGQGHTTLVFDDGAVVPDTSGAAPLVITDGSMTAYLYPVSTGTPSFVNLPDAAHHVTRVTRSWNSSDVVGDLHVMSYLIVFRPTGQPPPSVSGLALNADANGVTASAQVDGSPLSVSFKN